MKKSLIALAALSAFATAAQAQSSVSVYGIMDMSYGENKVSGEALVSGEAKNTKTTGLADDAVNSSRIGFRGTEDLGGGVKAGFVVEANLDMVRGSTFDKQNQTGGNGVTLAKTNEQGTAFLGSTRQSMLTLSDAKLGTLGVGYKKTLETDFNDLYFTGTENSAGNQSHVLGRATRANGMYYTSPAFSGVTVSAQLVAGEVTNQGDLSKTYDASMTQFGVNYAAGALQVGAVYFNGSIKIGTGGATNLVTDYADTNWAVGDNDYKGYGIGANYNFGFAKVTAQMGERKYGLAADQDKNEYTTLGVTFPVGKLDLMAAYAMQEIKTNGAKVSETDGYQLIARYNLSKRTNVYALVGENKKEVPTAGVADVKTSVARIGVAHSF